MKKIKIKTIIIILLVLVSSNILFSQNINDFSFLKYNDTACFTHYDQLLPLGENCLLINSSEYYKYDDSIFLDTSFLIEYGTGDTTVYISHANHRMEIIYCANSFCLTKDDIYHNNNLYGSNRIGYYNGHKLYSIDREIEARIDIYDVSDDKIIFDTMITFDKENDIIDIALDHHYLRNIYADNENKYLYTFTGGHLYDWSTMNAYGTHNWFEKIDIATHKVVGTINTYFVNSRTFLGNDKRLIWMAENRTAREGEYRGFERDAFKGIYYIEMDKEFDNRNVKIDTNWKFIKSALDKHYMIDTSLTEDTIISRYVKSLGFKDNNIFVMLRDKWVGKPHYSNVNINYVYSFKYRDLKWYENTIYVLDFNNLKQIGNSWDTLNLSEGFNLLETPEKWVIENREYVRHNYYLPIEWRSIAKIPNEYWVDGILYEYPWYNELYNYFYRDRYYNIDNFGIYKWSDNELAIAIQPKDKLLVNPYLENANRIFLIYNFDTKKWSKFTFPKEIFPEYSHKNVVNWNGIKYFHITPYDIKDTSFRNVLVKWDPKTGIKDSEDGIFMELGIRKIQPNPVNSRFSADIMCYVPNVNEVNVGLYNIFGQLVADFSNNFEYFPATHTIKIEYVIPPYFTTGVYYLKVNKGSETRTKPIIINNK